MKNTKHNRKLFKRIAAFATAAIMTFTALPLDSIEDIDFNLNFGFFDSLFVSADYLTIEKLKTDYSFDLNSDEISISDSDKLILLSNVNPEEYADKTIIFAMSGTNDLTKTVDGYSFLGLGSETSPFKGTLMVNDTDFTLSTAFFNAISDSATITLLQQKENADSNITLKSGGKDFCFIKNVVHDENSDSTLEINYFKIENNTNGISGIIDTIGKNAKVSLSMEITNSTDDDGNFPALEITSSSNAGLFCNTMEEKSQLTVTNFTLSDDVKPSSVSATSQDGSAGGAVGYMNSGATLIFAQNFDSATLVSSVTATANAGGLVGEATDAEITGTVNINSMIVGGSSNSGGLFGKYTSNAKEKTFDFNDGNISVKDVKLATGNSGGLFGELDNKGGTFTVSNISTDNTVTSTSESVVSVYGGLIGVYQSNDLTNTLDINKVNVSFGSWSDGNGGGIIGTVNSTDKAYVKIENATVKATSSAHAGLVDNAGSGNMLDILGTVTISGGSLHSGIAYSMSGGVLRLSGTTDMSGISFSNANTDSQIINTRGNGVVYAESWTFKRKSGSKISDIKEYGEVVRVTDKLDGLFTFKETEHTVTVANFTATDISSALDFAALSVSVQAKESSGALQLQQQFTDNTISDNITLTADIDMSDTGVTGITRDNGTQTYTGTFDGNNYKLTLNIGEKYGKDIDTSTDGVGQIYNHRYIGLFAKIDSATITNLTLKGTVNVGILKDSSIENLRVGSIAAEMSGNSTFDNVTVNTEINYIYHDVNGQNRTSYIGGFVGYTNTGTTATFSGCKWDGTINNTSKNTLFFNGGFIGYTERGITITATNDTISGTIDIKNGVNTAQVGGFIGSMSVGDTANTVNITNLKISNATITAASKDGSSGGFLGYDWYNTNVTINGLTITNSKLSVENKLFGGLVYQSSGYWKVTDDGITFDKGNTIKGKSTDDSPSALLISKGYDYQDKDSALYLEIGLKSDGTSAYTIDSSLTPSIPNSTYFDEIVGISQHDNGNGVVSIATAKHDPIDIDECNTYTNHLSTSYSNPNTRYYYNLDVCRSAGDDGKSTLDLTTVDSGEKMLCWSVYRYAEDNIKSYFASNTNSTTITGDINLKGLSYYPVDIYESVKIDNATITFDYENIETLESNNKQPSDDTKQHYTMHYGLFNNVTSTTSSGVSIIIEGLTLGGTVGKYADNNGSGAIICGTAQGMYNSSNGTATQITLSLKNITLDGIRVSGVDSYAPLLINKISEYSTLTANGITENLDSYTTVTATDKAATSLIGKVGYSDAVGISLDFQSIKLTATEKESIFQNATLLESFQYADDCYGTYNFTKADFANNQNVTYGKELCNTEGGTVSGRNNGAQYCYYDDTSKAVCQDIDPNADKTTYFATGYLRYVHQAESGDYHELDINQAWADLTEGCGTYGDPYIITDGAQLETIAKILAKQTGNSDITVDKEIFDSISDTFTGSGVTDYHVSTSADVNHKTITVNDTDTDTSKLITYLANAYYEIANDITLSGSFEGIGYKDPNGNHYEFCGVIFGKSKDIKVTITAPTSPTTYGGLVKYASGCVVKDLTITYDDTTPVKMAKGSTDSTTTDKRSVDQFFGGVIGYAIMGDNIIDNVSVTDYPTFDKSDSDYNLISIGGYVGMVGGGSGSISKATSNGGGVVFRNIADSGLTGTSVDNYYENPYIGRVLDGYACSEDSKLPADNGDNYKIPTISADTKLTISGTEITVNTPDELWVLSAIVNSGAGAQGVAAGTTLSNAYSYGKVRSKTYNYMGEDSEEAQNEAEADENYWGGKKIIKTDKRSYLIEKHVSDSGKDTAAQLTNNNNTAFTLNFTDNIDMTTYGNGFRGVGAAYQDNSFTAIKYRTLPLKAIVGNNYTITLARNVKEYKNETWWVQSLGLFPTINFKENATVENLTVSGEVTIKYAKNVEDEKDEKDIDKNFIGECSAGGFAGMTANGTGNDNNGSTTITNLQAVDLTVTGAKYSGGFVAVIGQSSRTTRKSGERHFTTTISSSVKSYTFTNCGYSGLTIEGSYSAGGFVSVYNAGNTLYINGTTTIGKSAKTGNQNYIHMINDAAADIYTWGSTDSTDTKDRGFTGSGGLVGCCKDTLELNKSMKDSDWLTIEDTTVTSVRLKHNTNYGMGGLIGTVKGTDESKWIYVYNVTMKNCTVQTERTNQHGYTFEGKFTSDKSYYLAISAGGICGQAQYFDFENITMEDSNVYDSGFMGGILGSANDNNSTKNDKILNCSLNNVKVYTQNAHTFDGFAEAGGLIGKVSNGTVTITDCKLDTVSVFSDGYSGGIAGAMRRSIILNNVELTNCNIATNSPGLQSKPSTGTYIFGDSQTDPSGDISEKNQKNQIRSSNSSEVSKNACAGGIVGNYTRFNTDTAIKGYNVLMKNNIIGFYVTGTSLADRVEFDKYSDLTLSAETIAVKDSSGNYVTYNNVNSNEKEKYTNGYDGIIIGESTSNGNNKTISFVGLCVIGDYTPYEYYGCGGSTLKTKYIVRSDYTGLFDNDDKPSDSKSPYVTINPDGKVDVYQTANKLTAHLVTDGVALHSNGSSIAKQIYSEIGTKSANLTYHDVSSLKSDITESRLTTFKNADTTSNLTYEGDDFSVLLIETNNNTAINNQVRQYVSLLTDLDQTDYTAWNTYVNSIDATTYQLQDGKFVSDGVEKTLTVADKTLTLTSGKHDNDNGKPQFTLLTINYKSPTDSSKYYTLYVPVYVKKVLEYTFSASVKSGTDYYAQAYENNSQVALANHGETVTALVRFTYLRDSTTWQTYLEGGDNLLCNFDKTVKYYDTTLPEGTDLVLLDANTGGSPQAFYATQGSSGWVSFHSFTDSNGKGWLPTPLCTILGIYDTGDNTDITDTSTILFQNLGSGEDGKIPDGATVKVGDVYYGNPMSVAAIRSEKTIPDDTKTTTVKDLNDALASLGVNLTYAKLKVPESVTENPNAQLDGENHAYEEYYITLQTPSTATNVYTSNVLVSDRSSDTMGDMYKPDGVEEKTVLPTLYQKTESTENTTYIIGNIYNQTIEIDGKGSELVDEDTEYIDADITATISANDTFKKFIENNQNVQISHGLDFDLILYQDDTGTATQTVEQFDANTSVQLLNYKINGTETVKSADPTAASSSLVEFNNIVEDLKSTITSNNEVTVTATVRINIGDIDEQFKNAYRDSSLDSTAGIAIRVTSKLGSENSYFKASDKTAQHYYVEKQKSASLSYNAAKDASFGGTTALGINPYELELDGDQSAAIIDSTAVYNLSDVTDKLESFSNDNLAVRYTLTLKQKQDSSAYIGVNIDDYLSDITLDNEEMTYDKDTTSYYITRKWSNDKTVDSFSVQFAVKTGVNEFEAQKMLYSNYEVVLDAQIYSYDSDINTPDTTVEGTAVSDYIIYTNARILLDLYQKQSNE